MIFLTIKTKYAYGFMKNISNIQHDLVINIYSGGKES